MYSCTTKVSSEAPVAAAALSIAVIVLAGARLGPRTMNLTSDE